MFVLLSAEWIQLVFDRYAYLSVPKQVIWQNTLSALERHVSLQCRAWPSAHCCMRSVSCLSFIYSETYVH